MNYCTPIQQVASKELTGEVFSRSTTLHSTYPTCGRTSNIPHIRAMASWLTGVATAYSKYQNRYYMPTAYISSSGQIIKIVCVCERVCEYVTQNELNI